MAKYVIDDATLTAIADSIRAKKKTTEDITPEGMPTEIESITTGEDLDAVLTEQENLIDELKTLLEGKAYGGEAEGAKIVINKQLTSYSDNEITAIVDYTFYRQGNLVSINTPNVTSIGRNSFSFCSSLLQADFPLCKSYGNDCFSYCYGLQYANLGIPTKIPSWLFASCSALETVIIKTTSVPNLVAANAFSGTKIATGGGYIYVPSALVGSYKTATNWATYADQIRAIEDYPDITGG